MEHLAYNALISTWKINYLKNQIIANNYNSDGEVQAKKIWNFNINGTLFRRGPLELF